MRVPRNNALAEWASGLIGDRPLRTVQTRTGVPHTTISRLVEGLPSSAETIIRFAVAYRASVPEALRLAGFEDLAEAWEFGGATLLEPGTESSNGQRSEAFERAKGELSALVDRRISEWRAEINRLTEEKTAEMYADLQSLGLTDKKEGVK